MEDDDEDMNIAPPLGIWDMQGRWYPNPHLNIRPGEQYEHNLKYGYLKLSPDQDDD